MRFEQYRNNKCYTKAAAGLKPPLKFDGETKITKGGHLLPFINVIDDRLYAGAITYLACFEMESRQILWEREDEEFIYPPATGEEDRIYGLVDHRCACLDAASGETIWIVDNKEYIPCASEQCLYCIAEDMRPKPVIYRFKRNGEERWRLPQAHGFPNRVVVEGDTVVIQGSEGFHICRESTGAVIWDLTREAWLDRYVQGKTYGPMVSVGPLAAGMLYLGWEGGLLTAMNTESGELVWALELPQPQRPHTMIYQDNKIYFNINQRWGSKNCLTCVDAGSGELIFQTDENFTDAGCVNPIIAGNYFIGGRGPLLSFFDMERGEFVWRYKHKKRKSIFGGPMYPYQDHLVTYDNAAKEIYWFRSKGK